MAETGGGGEKTEKASPKKRQDERKKGNVFMSKDVNTVAIILVAFFTLQFFVGGFIEKLQEMYRVQMTRASVMESVNPRDVMQIWGEAAALIATTALPVMLIIGAAAAAVSLLQTRFLFSAEQLKFKFERLSFFKGLKRLLSLRSLVELAKSIIKVVLIIWLLYGRIRDAIAYIPVMLDWDISQAAAFAGDQIMGLIITIAIAFGAVAAFDYLYQWWEYEKGIKMTKQEVKDEYKQMEGNPEIKGKRREKQREFAMQRMMQQVKEADVIVRNPTHFAVALKYKIDVDAAPVIIAKGQDLIAQRILAEAALHNIATIENKPLARGLYEMGEIGSVIPEEFFQPVAELLAWLYSTREKEKKPV